MLTNSEEGELWTAQRTKFTSMAQAAILHKRQTGKQFLRQEGKKDPVLSFTLPLPTAISTGGNWYERRAFRNKHEILHWQEGTYWLENFPVVVKALFPIQPNTQVLPAFFNPHYFFNQFKHGIGIKASKDLLPTLLAVFFKRVGLLGRTTLLGIKPAVLLQQAPAKSHNTEGCRAL